jgi:hypothetical protein
MLKPRKKQELASAARTMCVQSQKHSQHGVHIASRCFTRLINIWLYDAGTAVDGGVHFTETTAAQHQQRQQRVGLVFEARNNL